jgi:hypothetical protein
MALVLKLNEASFKPIFLQLVEFAQLSQPATAERPGETGPVPSPAVHVFYYVARVLAERLQVIFVPYFSYVIDDLLRRLEALPPLLAQATAPAESAKKKAKVCHVTCVILYLVNLLPGLSQRSEPPAPPTIRYGIISLVSVDADC